MQYAIGDVQGCFDGLEKLLDKVNFNPKQDELIFLGDVVNRGDKSLETLEFIQQTNSKVVLGNHDYYLLACYFGICTPHKKDTFLDVLNSQNVAKLIDFLLSRDIVLFENNAFFVHAGLPPIWNTTQIIHIASELKEHLNNNPEQFLASTFGDQAIFNDSLPQNKKHQYAINAFMRMRFCKKNGELNFTHKQNQAPDNFAPWFENNSLLEQHKIYFGHWSSLKNICQKNLYAMDTGYVWGESLSCVALENGEIFSVQNT